MKFIDLAPEQQLRLLNQVNAFTNQDQITIEKDWWVTQVLKAIFALPYAKELSFKGGTSLSKAWEIIDRFSEDIDIAISREYLGFGGELSKNQVSDRLRRASCTFVRETMKNDIHSQLVSQGISEDLFDVKVNITPISTTDPEVIWVNYHSILPMSEYIVNSVKVEVSGRSMQEPLVDVEMAALIDKYIQNSTVEKSVFVGHVVAPERTFLEKMMLLHEEFAKPLADVRTERMSRHLYDLYRMMLTPIADKALSNTVLYRSVMEHRRKFIGLRNFDYDTLQPSRLSLVIPTEVVSLWKTDYERMRKTMIYGSSPSWNELISTLQKLQDKVRMVKL